MLHHMFSYNLRSGRHKLGLSGYRIIERIGNIAWPIEVLLVAEPLA